MENTKDEDQLEGFVYIDTTYKLTAYRFPFAILSTRDKRRRLRNIVILSNERKIVLYSCEGLKRMH